MIKAIIFDLNGVFLKSRYLSERFEEKYGVHESDFLPALKEVMRVVRKPRSGDAFKFWRPHLNKFGVNISKKEFFNFWFSGERLVPGLINYTKELREKGLKIFILSNNFKERTEYYRKNFPEIFENVDEAYFSWETGYVKPDNKAYLNILTQNNLKPGECIYFDDLATNVKIAKKVGIHAYNYEDINKTRRVVKKELAS